MKDIKRILVVIDPTETRQTGFDRAIELGKSLGAELGLLICDRDPIAMGRFVASPAGLENARAALEADHRKRLDYLAGQAEALDIPKIGTDVRWDYPLADGIAHEVEENQWDLVVKDTHHHGPIARTFLTNTDWELIKHCPRPLWLVKPEVSLTPARIIAAVAPFDSPKDDRSLDCRILQAAEQLNLKLNGKLHILNVYPVPGGAGTLPYYTPDIAPSDDLVAHTEKEHREAMSELLRECNVLDADISLRAGVPQDQIIDFAKEVAAGLVVMGAVSRSMIERVVLGSTAERVLDRLPSDLLIIK